MRLALPYPHKALWPNGRPHWAERAREVKKHRGWACALTKGHMAGFDSPTPIPVRITVHGRPRGPMPDRDGVVSAAKAYLDGIADALKINDRTFLAPTVEFASERGNQFIIELGEHVRPAFPYPHRTLAEVDADEGREAA